MRFILSKFAGRLRVVWAAGGLLGVCVSALAQGPGERDAASSAGCMGADAIEGRCAFAHGFARYTG